MGNLNIDSQMLPAFFLDPPKLTTRNPCRDFFVGAEGLGLT